MTEYLSELLKKKGHTFSTAPELKALKKIKESITYVAQDYDEAIADAQNSSAVEKSYEMPDG